MIYLLINKEKQIKKNSLIRIINSLKKKNVKFNCNYLIIIIIASTIAI